MSSSLGGITNASIRDCVGTRCFVSGALAIDGVNTENVQTTVAVAHVINGVFQTDLATQSELDIDAAVVINGKTGEVQAAGSSRTFPAGAAGDDDQTLYFVLACKGNVSYVIEGYPDIAAIPDDAETWANYELTCPSGYAPYGVVKLVRTAADTETFQFGNDTSAQGDLDQTGRTATFFNISVLPAKGSDLVTV